MGCLRGGVTLDGLAEITQQKLGRKGGGHHSPIAGYWGVPSFFVLKVTVETGNFSRAPRCRVVQAFEYMDVSVR